MWFTWGGASGSDAVIRTVVINNSAGNVSLDTVLQACEDAGYTLTHDNCILWFRSKGTNAHSSPPNNYTYNNHMFVVKDGAIWNVVYNSCLYTSGAKSPDEGFPLNANFIRTNNAIGDSGGIVDANKKIVNTYATPFQGIGGAGTTVTLYEIPVTWSDFLTTI